MNVLVVTAHDDPKSLVAALHNTALGVLERAGHTVSVTELYQLGFNPVASMLDFEIRSSEYANYMFEQQRTVNTGTKFSPDIAGEMEKITQADLVIIHFPLWWGSVPAIVKGWVDRVFAMGFAWGPENRYEKGLLRGKRVLVTVSAGDPLSFYSPEGMHNATIEQHLYSLLHGTFAFCGMDVLKPAIIANTTAASREELEEAVVSYQKYLQDIESNHTYIYKHA